MKNDDEIIEYFQKHAESGNAQFAIAYALLRLARVQEKRASADGRSERGS